MRPYPLALRCQEPTLARIRRSGERRSPRCSDARRMNKNLVAIAEFRRYPRCGSRRLIQSNRLLLQRDITEKNRLRATIIALVCVANDRPDQRSLRRQKMFRVLVFVKIEGIPFSMRSV